MEYQLTSSKRLILSMSYKKLTSYPNQDLELQVDIRCIKTSSLKFKHISWCVRIFSLASHT